MTDFLPRGEAEGEPDFGWRYGFEKSKRQGERGNVSLLVSPPNRGDFVGGDMARVLIRPVSYESDGSERAVQRIINKHREYIAKHMRNR